MALSVQEMLHEIEKEEWLRAAPFAIKNFSDFCKQAWPHLLPGVPLQWAWFHDAICEHLQAAFNREINRIVINIGPGHSKSTLISVMFHPWCWIHKPHQRWLCASNNIGLAVRDNSEARRLIETEWYQTCFGDRYQFSESQNTKTFYQNDRSGYRATAAVSARTTGKRADALMIDDPHDAMEGEKERLKALEWFATSWTQRLNDQENGLMAVIGQRIHAEDLTGHILSKLFGWEHLCLPEEFELARKCFTSIGWEDPRIEEGELLWPERMSRSVVDTMKKSMGSMGFAAQYQQSPVPSDGGIIKKQWLRYFTQTPDAYILHRTSGDTSVLKSDCWRFTVADVAISSKQTADYTVIQTYDVTPQNDLLLIDQIRDRMDNPQQQKVLRMVYTRLNPKFIKVESVAYQLALIQQLRNEPTDVRDFLVGGADPVALDATLRALPGAGAFLLRERDELFGRFVGHQTGVYVARVLGDAEFFKFAVEQQGYCKILGQPGMDSHQISIPVKEYKPNKSTGDKVARASTAAIWMENEKFFLQEDVPYLNELETEILTFPLGSHDDQMDDISMACNEVTTPNGSGVVTLNDDDADEQNDMLEPQEEDPWW